MEPGPVSMVLNLRVSWKASNLLSTWATMNFVKKILDFQVFREKKYYNTMHYFNKSYVPDGGPIWRKHVETYID
jgi:hypothetical protein